MRSGDFESALRDCNEAIRLEPTFAMGYAIRAWYYVITQELDKAVADANEAIKLDAKRPGPYVFRAAAAIEGVWGAQGMPEKEAQERRTKACRSAISDCDMAIANYGACTPAYRVRGMAKAMLGDPNAGKQDCDKAIQLDPLEPDGYAARGLILVELEAYEAAVKDFTEALDRKTIFLRSKCLWHRGLAYLHLKKPAFAIQDFSELAGLAPDDPDIYRARRRAYEATGEKELAEADRKKAAALEKQQK